MSQSSNLDPLILLDQMAVTQEPKLPSQELTIGGVLCEWYQHEWIYGMSPEGAVTRMCRRVECDLQEICVDDHWMSARES